jgi:starvation-inducible DNA-binding protein
MRKAPLLTPTDLNAQATQEVAASMNGILVDVFALYFDTKQFHWHMSGAHFRDYHLMLDEQDDRIFAMTECSRRARSKRGRLRAEIHRPCCPYEHILDNDRVHRTAGHARRIARRQRNACVKTARSSQCLQRAPRHCHGSLIEIWIDETERRTWFFSWRVAEAIPRRIELSLRTGLSAERLTERY